MPREPLRTCGHGTPGWPRDRREPRADREVSRNSDNIDYGEMIHVQDGTEEGITTFTDRGIESLQEFLADVRTWNGGVRQFLID